MIIVVELEITLICVLQKILTMIKSELMNCMYQQNL